MSSRTSEINLTSSVNFEGDRSQNFKVISTLVKALHADFDREVLNIGKFVKNQFLDQIVNNKQPNTHSSVYNIAISDFQAF